MNLYKVIAGHMKMFLMVKRERGSYGRVLHCKTKIYWRGELQKVKQARS